MSRRIPEMSNDEMRAAGVRIGRNPQQRPFSGPKTVARVAVEARVSDALDTGRLPARLAKDLSARATIPFGDGFYVYVLQDRDYRILYVGQTKNVMRRLGQHQDSGKEFACATVFTCRDDRHMSELEREFIRVFTPPLNVVEYKGGLF